MNEEYKIHLRKAYDVAALEFGGMPCQINKELERNISFKRRLFNELEKLSNEELDEMFEVLYKQRKQEDQKYIERLKRVSQ